MHALFDGLQVFRRERPLIGEVVIEAVLDHRADGHLGIGKQFLDGIGQQVGSGMTNQFQAVRVLLGHDRQLAVGIHDKTGIHQLAVHLSRQRGLGQARADACRNLGDRNRTIKASDRTIR